MENKKALTILFERFWNYLDENTYKCAFKSKSGQYYQGWLEEVKDGYICFYDSSPYAKETPYFIKLEDIDVHSLTYYDHLTKSWKPFH
mgnify:CR=1 FL=1